MPVVVMVGAPLPVWAMAASEIRPGFVASRENLTLVAAKPQSGRCCASDLCQIDLICMQICSTIANMHEVALL